LLVTFVFLQSLVFSLQKAATGVWSHNTATTIRVGSRQWNIPLDKKIGSRITRILLVDPDTHPDNITVSLNKIRTNYGPFHDASGFFELFPIKSGIRGDIKYDIILKKPLLGKFEAGDQFNLEIQANDGVTKSSSEIYGRIEEARDPDLHPEELTSEFPHNLVRPQNKENKNLLEFAGVSTHNTAIRIRVESRQWNIPLDEKAGSRITRILLVDPDTHPDNITVSINKIRANYGPFHDASGFFELFPINSGISGDIKYDVILKKPLLGKFEAGDQFNLDIQANDGHIRTSSEIYGRIEEARDRDLYN